MQSKAEWESRRSSTDCAFDLPDRDVAAQMIEVARLSTSTLYLERIQTYRGHCVLVFDPRHATRIDELSPDEWRGLTNDLWTAEKAVYEALKPDHMNVASIGQVVPHLHWHIIPRYVDDPRWGGPIWTTGPAEMQKIYLDEEDYASLVGQIAAALVS